MKAFAIAGALLLAQPAAAVPAPARQAENVRIFDRAWDIVGRRYWDRSMHGLDWSAERARFVHRARDAEDPRALYAAINALLDRLGDSHVYAVAPEPRLLRAGGDAESGFGFGAYRAQAQWIVHRVEPGGPAAEAGMRIGWRLLEVDGKPADARFGEGDTLTLLLEDEAGRRHRLALRAAPLVPEPSRRARRLPGDVLLLGFDQFSGGEDRWLAGALRGAPYARGVILDLRENEGGEADILDRIAGMFVADRQIVLRLSARRTRDERTRGRSLWAGPLAVLVGPRTASAGEALAAFLGESGRAITVGERTAGALTAGVEHRLPDGGRLTVAEQDIRTAGGARLEGVGYVPAHVVAPSLAQRRSGADPVLDRAIALLEAYSGGASISMSPPSVR